MLHQPRPPKSPVPPIPLITGFVVLLAFIVVSEPLHATCASPMQCADAPPDMVAWWPGDDHARDIADDHNGTLQDGASFTAGKVGAAFQFDGIDDGLFIPDSADFDWLDFTLEAWIKTPDAGAGRRRIISQQPSPGSYWVLSLNNNQLEICSALDFGCQQAGPLLNDDQFHHVAGVREAGVAMRWYIDGALVQSTPISSTVNYALNDHVYIGRLTPLIAVNEFFNGIIDEVAMFDRALSDDEIQSIFDAGSAGKCKAWTDLGGGSPGIAGQPELVGSGVLLGGTPASVTLTNAPPGALMLAWISVGPTPFLALGGTVHAHPFVNQLLFLANGSGSFTGATTWPVGLPPGTQAWFQFLVQDVSVPDGITLSNGLHATTP